MAALDGDEPRATTVSSLCSPSADPPLVPVALDERPGGDHPVLAGVITGSGAGDGEALLYHRGRFGTVVPREEHR